MPEAVRSRHVAARVAGAVLGATLVAFGIASCTGEFTAPPPNTPPVATMAAPVEGATFSAGDTIAYAGTGNDAEDGDIRASHVAWWVELVSGDLVTMVVPRTTGTRRGSIVVPTRGDVSPEMRYRFHLEVRDGRDGADTVVREIAPRTATMRFETVPAGLHVIVDGDTAASPRDVVGVVRSEHEVEVASPQVMGTSQYVFSGWSDGTARAHALATPATGTTWVATFALVPPPNVPPTVAIASPVAGSTLRSGTPMVVRATAADADGRVARVELLVDGTPVGAATSAPYDIAWTPAALGPSTLVARAVDDSGATTVSGAVTVTIVAPPPPNVPPTVALTAPAEGSTLTIGAPVALRASASDADGRVTRVEFVAAGSIVGAATASPYELSWTPTALGAVTLTARATDDSGAVATSATVTVNVVPAPNVPPTVSLVQPAAGSSFTVGTTVTLRADAADADGRVVRIAFRDGATLLGEATAAPFELAWTPTAPGTHALTAEATDDAGAIVTSGPVTVTVVARANVSPTVSLTAPIAGTTVVLGAEVTLAADASDADGVVRQVEFLANGGSIGMATASPFTATWIPSAIGTVDLVARATDDSGAVATSAAVRVTVVAPPNQLPTVALTSPAPGSSFVLGTTISLRAAASDPDGRVTQVAFLDGGTAVGTVPGAPFELAWTPTTVGSHAITARATDDAGAIVMSAPVSVAITPVPNRAPSVTLTTPTAGTTVVLGSTTTLAASATDADGTIARVEFLANGTIIGSDDAAPFTFAWTPSVAGQVSLVARAVDDSAAVTTSAAVTVTVVAPPNRPPVVELAAPVNGSTVTVGLPVTLRATASDADGRVVRVELLAGGTVLGAVTEAPFELAWTPAAVGSVALTARATDDSGAVVTSAAVTVNVVAAPNVAPTVALSLPAPGSSFTLGTTISVRATAADADGRVTRVTIHDGGTLVATLSVEPWEVAWMPTTTGVHVLTAQATDDAGAITVSAPVSVTIVPLPNRLPTVAIVAPLAGATLTARVPTTLRASAADADGRVVEVAWFANGALVGAGTTSPFELAWTPASAGQVTLVARATDDSSAVVNSAPVTVTVVSPPNVAPTVSLTSPAPGSSITAGTSVMLRASASDVDGSVASVSFRDGATLIGMVTSAPYELSWTPTTLGAHSLTAVATDDAGASTTSAAVAVTIVGVPNVPPAVALTSPTNGSIVTVGTAVALGATANDADGRVTQVEFLANGSVVATASASPFAATWTPTATGAVTIVARAMDDSGSVTLSAPVSVTVLAPNRPPVATISAPAAGATFRAGDVVTYAGSGTDPEQGAIPAARTTWWIDLHHDTHTHPFVPPTSGALGGTVTLPTETETSADIWYRFHLVVTDTGGLADTVTRDILPVTSTMRFTTVPAGLVVTVDGQPRTTPIDIVGVVGTTRHLGVPSPQALGGTQYVFDSWSDGGAATHDIATPEASTTYTATFKAVAPANVPPTVSIAAPTAGATLTTGVPVTVRANAADTDGTVAQVTFFVDGVAIGTATASPFEVTWTPTTLGTHQLTARAVDDDGDATTSVAIGVTVQAAGGGDVVAPTVAITAPANNANGLTGAVVVNATASDNVGVAGVSFQLDGEAIDVEDTSAPYSVTIPSTAAYTTGQHVIRARARDAAGNLSPWATVTVGFGGSVNLPAGFARAAYVNGLPAVTTMVFAPDGRLLIAEQGGRLRVVKNGVLLSTPFHTFPTSANGERGLLGVAFDPAFATNRWVYAYYTASGPTRNIVVRLRASATNGDVADASDIDTLLTLPNLGPTNHNGGALHFGPDGTLYIAVGDNGTETNAPLLTTPLGKILRINPDGTIPSNNPFLAQTSGTNRAIWARGLRNPFTFGFQPGTGRMMINDVGQGAWEEVNEGVIGSNYGWPDTEGYTTNPAFRSPLYAYPHSGGITIGFAIVGAAFYNPPVTTFPAAWVGDYFFGDYVEGWVARMDFDNANAVYAFARFPNTLVFDVRTGPDGALYVLSDNVNGSNGVWRIERTP